MSKKVKKIIKQEEITAEEEKDDDEKEAEHLRKIITKYLNSSEKIHNERFKQKDQNTHRI